MPAEAIDGMERMDRARGGPQCGRARRAGDGPVFIEALTYRFVGHSRSDPGKYRPEGELERWQERDPIVLLRAQLEAEGVDATELDEIERELTERARAHACGRARGAVPGRVTAREFKD